MMKHLAKNTRPVTNTENTPRVKPHFEEPTLKDGFRPSFNMQQLAGAPVFLQEPRLVQPHEMKELIRKDEDIEALTENAFCNDFNYRLNPCIHDLPYFYACVPHYDREEHRFPEQPYFYVLRVVTGGYHHAGQYYPDRDAAERWRLMLMNDFPRRVRMAYVGPSDDCVYLIIQSRLWGGCRTFDEYSQLLVKDADSFRNHLFSYYTKGEEAPEIIVHFEPYAYVCHDEGVLYRPYIKTHKEEQEALSQYLREMYGKIKHQHPP